MNDTKNQKTVSISEIAMANQISLSAAEYRIEYGINSIDDCQNASEECLCEFVSDSTRLSLAGHAKLDDNSLFNLDTNDLSALYAMNINGKNVGMLTNTKTRVITTN